MTNAIHCSPPTERSTGNGNWCTRSGAPTGIWATNRLEVGRFGKIGIRIAGFPPRIPLRIDEMCTLTFIPDRNGYMLAMNRDERISRGISDPPAVTQHGGIEAVYDDLPKPIGMMAFAPVKPARGPMFGARARAGRGESVVAVPAGVSERELYE